MELATTALSHHEGGPTTGLVPKGDFKRAGGFMGLRGLIADKGGNPAALLRQVGIDPARLDDRDAYLPYSPMIRLLEHCADELGTPFFGFELGTRQSMEVHGPLAVVLLSSSTIGQGLELVARYMAIHAPGARCALNVQGSHAHLSYEVIQRATRFSRQINEMSMAVAYRTMKDLAGADFSLDGVDIAADAPGHCYKHLEAFFGAPVAYEQPTSMIRFSARHIGKRIDTGNPMLLRFAQAQCDALFDQGDQLEDLVAGHIRRLLPMGGCNLNTVARYLSIHPRSLQNRLTAEGLEFRKIMQDQRQSLAQGYLLGTRTPIAEIAALLGYSDQAALTRAFSGWTGTSPQRYRKSGGGAAGLSEHI